LITGLKVDPTNGCLFGAQKHCFASLSHELCYGSRFS